MTKSFRERRVPVIHRDQEMKLTHFYSLWCFYIDLKSGPDKCAKLRGETDQSLQSFCSIMSFWKHRLSTQSTVLLSSKKSLHQRRQKEMPVPIQGFQLSYQCVIMNENCFHPGCLASNPSGLHYYVDIFHIKTEHFNSWISLRFHLISTLPPLLSGVMCNANFGEHCTPSPNQTSLIFLGLSTNQLHWAWGEERQRDISALLSFQSEL